MICNECETVAHCTKHGCVPKQPAPVQPVAWAMYQRGRLQSFWLDKGDAYDFEFTSEHEWKPLYTTPPAQPAPVQETPFQIGQRLRQEGKGISDLWGAVSSDADMPEAQRGFDSAAQPAPVQEPVAWRKFNGFRFDYIEHQQALSGMVSKEWKPLYDTTPPAAQRQWVGLTEEEMYLNCPNWLSQEQCKVWIQQIEAKLKEKNAAAQPAVPDAIHHTDLSESLEYIQGWNDCRQAMLEMMK